MKMREYFKNHRGGGHETIFNDPIAEKLMGACSRIKTAANLIEHKTNAPSTLFFCLDMGSKEIIESVNEIYQKDKSKGVWDINK